MTCIQYDKISELLSAGYKMVPLEGLGPIEMVAPDGSKTIVGSDGIVMPITPVKEENDAARQAQGNSGKQKDCQKDRQS